MFALFYLSVWTLKHHRSQEFEFLSQMLYMNGDNEWWTCITWGSPLLLYTANHPIGFKKQSSSSVCVGRGGSCNPSYSGGRDQEDWGLKILKKHFTKIGLELVEWLKLKALSSNSSTANKRKRKQTQSSKTKWYQWHQNIKTHSQPKDHRLHTHDTGLPLSRPCCRH
jgi:hypothetical protein